MFSEHDLDVIAAALGRQAWWLQSLDSIGGNTAEQQGECLSLKAKAISLFLQAKREREAKENAASEKEHAVKE